MTDVATARLGRPAAVGWLAGVPLNLALGLLAFFPLLFTRLVFSAIAFRLGDFSAFEARDGIDVPIFMAAASWLLFLPLWWAANKLIVLWTVVPRRWYWLAAAVLPVLVFLAELVFDLKVMRMLF